MKKGERAPIILRISIDVEPDEDGFHAYCPVLKGLHTCGNTEEEAVNNAVEASLAYLESIIKHGEPFPAGILVNQEKEFEETVPRHIGIGHHQHVQTLELAPA